MIAKFGFDRTAPAPVCFFEVVDNSIDEALAGHATLVDVRLRADGSVSVEDDGRGIPCDVHAKTGRPALETVLNSLPLLSKKNL